MESSRSYDVLVVGGGIAGLTAAAYLSRAGLRVLLCEKETQTGGLVNSFEHQGFVFDGGIRAIENSGVVLPMLRQLGIAVDFLPSPVSIGIGKDVIRITSGDSLRAYSDLLKMHFPENTEDITRIVREIRKIMGYMDVLYGIDNPLFLDLNKNPGYVLRTILPWLLKYILTMPRIARLNKPTADYVSGFTANQALTDVITQHFFQKTPAFFALSYFRLYLDYQYPRGGTGALTRALEQFVVSKGGEIRRQSEIISVDPGNHQAVDSRGNLYQYRRLVWAANQKTLYRILNLRALSNDRAVNSIQARQQALSGRIGGDSVFTLYLTLNLDKPFFQEVPSTHLFYTPAIRGLSRCSLDDLLNGNRIEATPFVPDRPAIVAWLERYLELTTYEVSCPALRDSALAPEGKTGLIVSALFDYSLTKHIQSMGWYEEFRNLMSERIIEKLDASIFPGLKAAVIDSFTSTPLTIERISGNSEGAITGWAFTNESMPAVNKLWKIATSVLTPIPDTFQAGQWTFSPSGLPISILTGKLAADRIIKELG